MYLYIVNVACLGTVLYMYMAIQYSTCIYLMYMYMAILCTVLYMYYTIIYKTIHVHVLVNVLHVHCTYMYRLVFTNGVTC